MPSSARNERAGTAKGEARVTGADGAPVVRVYLDAAPVIYAVEQVPGYGAAVDARLSAPGVVPVTSEPTRLECRVTPPCVRATPRCSPASRRW